MPLIFRPKFFPMSPPYFRTPWKVRKGDPTRRQVKGSVVLAKARFWHGRAYLHHRGDGRTSSIIRGSHEGDGGFATAFEGLESGPENLVKGSSPQVCCGIQKHPERFPPCQSLRSNRPRSNCPPTKKYEAEKLLIYRSFQVPIRRRGNPSPDTDTTSRKGTEGGGGELSRPEPLAEPLELTGNGMRRSIQQGQGPGLQAPLGDGRVVATSYRQPGDFLMESGEEERGWQFPYSYRKGEETATTNSGDSNHTHPRYSRRSDKAKYGHQEDDEVLRNSVKPKMLYIAWI